MKKILFTLSIFASILANGSEEWNYRKYFRVDSAYTYTWDKTASTWNLSSSQIYYYETGLKPDSIISRSFVSGLPLAKSVFSYNNNGLLSVQEFYSWIGQWVPSARNLFTYDQNGNISEVLVQVFQNGTWVSNRWQKEYIYDLSGRLSEYKMYYWRNNAWSLPTTDISTYDETGKLVGRQAQYSNGTIDYRITYGYDSIGLRTEAYAQFPSGTGWNNWWRNTYQYDNCGKGNSVVQYKGVLNNWELQSRTVEFNSFNTEAYPGKKVPLCHKGNTIYVSKNAIAAHLKHGDCIGECISEKEQDKKKDSNNSENRILPFTIYPNPAKEKITIKFNEDAAREAQRLELTDFFGKLIKSYKLNGQEEFTIYRENLLSGKYYIRLSGKETWSALVIFE